MADLQRLDRTRKPDGRPKLDSARWLAAFVEMNLHADGRTAERLSGTVMDASLRSFDARPVDVTRWAFFGVKHRADEVAAVFCPGAGHDYREVVVAARNGTIEEG